MYVKPRRLIDHSTETNLMGTTPSAPASGATANVVNGLDLKEIGSRDC